MLVLFSPCQELNSSPTTRRMWGEVTISPANRDEYEALCLRLSEGQRIFNCGHRLALHQTDDEWENTATSNTTINSNTESRTEAKTVKLEISPNDERNETTHPNEKTDIRALQREVIRILHTSGAVDGELYKAVGYKEVCEGEGEDIEEEVILRACSKAEKRDRSVVALVGKLLLLPKLFHLDTQLSTPVTDALTHLMEAHTPVVVESVLHPLLLHLPTLHQQHRDLLTHLLPTCSPHLATRLLRAFSERTQQTDTDTDLPTLHLLLEASDPKDLETHSTALTAIANVSHLHSSNVRFGQCLSVALKRFGPHMSDLEGLRFAVNTHTSSLRKLLESQLKRLDRKR
ncbi:uncharacterized protein LOC126981843 isoform X2 [Eriocheir sinensis]|uniref:uncharacterized protein LOC126981843 isoform X2 n=1 Tax=Eriocheir sinensis TaxID=95602 RepID=UPI0021C92707|nr:uncharacterized protein LOC126981843 isoform X2 [Eriocheir sinensis]